MVSAPGRPPESDVSAGVGLSGVLGLFVWLAICRNWPSIAPMMGFAGEAAPLNGPNAALAAMLFSGIPMVLWSLCVDKVHRRASTGIDWHSPRPLSVALETSVTKLAGLWATWAVIGVIYCLGRWYWRGNYLFAIDVLGTLSVPLLLLSIPYVLWLDRYLVNPRDQSWHFGAMLIGREAYDSEKVAHHLRGWAVKGFFIAFMFSILPAGWQMAAGASFADVDSSPVAFCMFLINMMFMVDVQIAMVGYLLTLKPLDAQIRTANPYLGGWLSALMCYPPFLLMNSGDVLDYHVNTADWAYWFQGHTALLWLWGAILVVLTGIYAWATVAFGIRFSNLTYRGILTNGPYRFTRHPAYLSKNIFWWMATLPFFVTSGSFPDMVRNTVILGLVSAIYYWRARTEEKHLLASDAKYREYHAWMAENAFITRSLGKLGNLFKPRGPRLQPAK
ncbi:protein-S-isoprenylcysteine methyltransferase [Croceicoccus estronivorus]|uniref:methyltransferase family protein n=1 Tax=Croceicoccus estronivorus TaxID=1172626 RepID=UPI00083247E9|nr:protein-S-isoprenylcysteine methyltransferase [Croceicoccus estronivorus]